MKKSDLTGKKFGKLMVLREGNNKGKNTTWLCRCDCGNEKEILTYNLVSGKSKTCGCSRVDSMKKLFTTHGQSKTRLYSIYKGMSQRCKNKNATAYKYYGGKGVTICKEWDDDFLEFKKWSIENGYTEELSIDRIDVNGNYEPSNCRWVSFKKQQNNKLNSLFLTIGNEKLTVAEWAEKNGTNKQTLYSKIYRLLDQLDLLNSNVDEFKIFIKD